MKPEFGIRTKILLSILLLLVVSFSILLCTSIISVDSFVARMLDVELTEHLRYLQSQFYLRAENVRDSLRQPLSAHSVQERLRAHDRPWLRGASERWRSILPHIDFLTVFDEKGQVLIRQHQAVPSGEFVIPDLVARAFREKKPIITTELISGDLLQIEAGKDAVKPGMLSGGSSMVIIVVVPSVTEDGKVVGGTVAGDILNGDMFLADHCRRLFGNEGDMAITQRGVTIISSSQKDILAGKRLSPLVMSHLKAGRPYAGEEEVEGTSQRVAYLPILDGDGAFIGSLAVSLSVDEYRMIRRASENNILLAAVVAILFSFYIANRVSKRLAEPLRSLANGVRMIEAGDLTHRVEVQSNDEVGQLARSFNSMASNLSERNTLIATKTEALQQLNELLERRVAERTEQLKLEIGKIEAILTSMDEGIVVVDQERRVTQFNPAAQRIFEKVPHRVIGRPFEQLCDAEGCDELVGLVSDLGSASESGHSGEMRLRMRGKQLVVKLSVLQESGGDRAGVVLSLRDVTAEEDVDRMKTDFISMVSHELKTPLTSIKGALQFIMNKGKWLTATERELISVCLRNTDRLVKLISDILDISKIEAGRAEFSYMPQSVNELAICAIEEVKGVALGRGITVINCVPADLPMVYGDHDRLVQVLTNLLSNAVKFSPEHKVVMVDAARTGNYMTISVADSGHSIEWTDRSKLFRKFQQLERDDMGSRGGTGLGLAICKEIVERHHGRIYYDSGKSGGNVFAFTVPICEERHEG